MSGIVVPMTGTVTALLSCTFPTLKPTDFLQDREFAGRFLAAITDTTVTMATGRDNTVGAVASLDLSEGDVQTGQRVSSVTLSLVPLLGLQSCRVAVVTGRRLRAGGELHLRQRGNL